MARRARPRIVAAPVASAATAAPVAAIDAAVHVEIATGERRTVRVRVGVAGVARPAVVPRRRRSVAASAASVRVDRVAPGRRRSRSAASVARPGAALRLFVPARLTAGDGVVEPYIDVPVRVRAAADREHTEGGRRMARRAWEAVRVRSAPDNVRGVRVSISGLRAEAGCSWRRGEPGHRVARRARESAARFGVARGARGRPRRGESGRGAARRRARVATAARIGVVRIEHRPIPRASQHASVALRGPRVGERVRVHARARTRRTCREPAPDDGAFVGRQEPHVIASIEDGNEQCVIAPCGHGEAIRRAADRVGIRLRAVAGARCKTCVARCTSCVEDRADVVDVRRRLRPFAWLCAGEDRPGDEDPCGCPTRATTVAAA